MIRRPPRSTRTDTLFPYRRSSDLLGEAVDARFGGGVIDLAILPRLAVDRTDVDDPPPFTLAHPRKHRLGHVEAAAEVGAQHLVPHLVGHLRHTPVPRAPRIVDHDIDHTPALAVLCAPLLSLVKTAKTPFV